MVHDVIFQCAVMLSIFKLGLHIGATQIENVTTGSLIRDDISKILPASKIEKGFARGMAQVVRLTNSPQQKQRLNDIEQIWSPERETHPISPLSHILKQDPKPSLSCSSDEFACGNGHMCIPEHLLCDGFKSCGDGSDESSKHGCGTPQAATCPPGKWLCPSLDTNVCIDVKKICDDKLDCPNGADEGPGCDNVECDRYGCSNGS